MGRYQEILDDILKREGGYVNHPADKGGRTDRGITERDHPEAWADGKVTEDEAREIYLRLYIEGPGFDQLDATPHLQAQLIDYGVNSGPMIAIKRLQEVLNGLTGQGLKVDGVLGPNTLSTLDGCEERVVNNLLMVERLKMFGRIVARDKRQAAFVAGWVNRATAFMVL